jgi:CrcB protein
MTWLAIAAGGALGSLARHGANVAISRALGSPVPYATFAVNVIGCFVIGVLAGLVAADRLQLSTTMRAFLFVGVLGGFTTFSSFGLDTFTLATTGQPIAALGNVLGQIVLGLGAVAVGYSLVTI